MNGQRIYGVAAYELLRTGHSNIFFDTHGLVIKGVTTESGTALKYMLGEETLLGQALRVELPNILVNRVHIEYETGPSAKALQWLSPVQTTDKDHPFLFTQGEAILTRSWIPIQDSPGIRFTYNAVVNVPKGLMAVMSAENSTELSPDGVYHFTMDKPVPAYLIALAVGDIVFKPLSARTGVYAERGVVEKAAFEFADMEKMLVAAEELYGQYRWGRYDVLVTPASFPFGGMENPMLTFATPTILAGDRSLTSLVAHELAHSWSGNLVTNATWDDFWLNEGFTVYFERRIMEKLYGPDYAAMLAVIGHQDLLDNIEAIMKGDHPGDTRLKLNLSGRDPDDGMTRIAYEKGYAFLRRIEDLVGRKKFDAFVRGYFKQFAFQAMTTEAFEDYLKRELLKPEKVHIDLDAWIHQPGLPADAISPTSELFHKVDAEITRFNFGAFARDLETSKWSAFEWVHFLRHLPKTLMFEQMKELDDAFSFTTSGNSEILAAWFEHCIRNDYQTAHEKLEMFLVNTGRRKFLMPLYGEMIKTEPGIAMALSIYQKAKPNYHSISVRSIDALLGLGE